jgi:hypothetical protein
MPKYTKLLEKLRMSSEEERSKFIFENKNLCVCRTCRSYNPCAEKNKEVLFCLAGESPICIKEAKGCYCHRCPFNFKAGLTKGFFCLRGSEEEQRKKRSSA